MARVLVRSGSATIGAREPTDDPDIGLMLRVQSNDEEAFRILFRKHSPRVLQFVRRWVVNDGIADELAQDVFVQLYRARGRYRPEARFSTWLYTIAANVCRNEMRRPEHQLRVRPQPHPDGVEPADPEPLHSPGTLVEEHVSGRELEARLRRALAELPEKQRAALLLSRVDGLAYREVARVLKTTEGAVKALLFRATHSLKRQLHVLLHQ